MAITTTTPALFRFINTAAFNSKKAGNTLEAGSFYSVDGLFYFATAGNTVDFIGNTVIGVPPAIGSAKEGVWYYNPSTGTWHTAVKVNNTLTMISLTDAVKSIEAGAGPNLGKYVITKMDGSTIVLELPKTNSVNAVSPSDVLLVTEQAVVTYVNGKVGGVLGGIRYKGSITSANRTTLFTPGGAQEGDMYRVSEPIASSAPFNVKLDPGDWVVFKTTVAAPSPSFISSAFDVFTGVENAAVDALNSTSVVLPLSANQGRVLDGKIDVKMDKITSATGGRVAITEVGGGVTESTKIIGGSEALPNNANIIPNSKQVTDALALKAGILGSGTANRIVTASDTGALQGTTVTLAASNSNPVPASGTASTSVIPNEAQVRAALDAVAASATVNWLLS